MSIPLEQRAPLKVFIVGAARSGTSILLFALKDAFKLPGYGESHVMPAFQNAVLPFRSYMERFASNSDPMLLKELPQAGFEQHLFEYFRRFYHARYPAGRWVDKTPGGEAVFGLPLIEAIFPDARLIAAKRNGIEVVTSHIKKFRTPFEAACRTWTHAMKGIIHARTTCLNLLEVDQFYFQNHTAEVSRNIADHLGEIDRAEDLSEYFKTRRVQHSSTHDPQRRLKLADTDWSTNEIKIFKRVCGDMMERFEYEL